MSSTLVHAVRGRSTRRASGYAAVAVGALVAGAVVGSWDPLASGQRLGLGVTVAVLATAVAAIQSARNRSPVLSLAITLGATVGLAAGLVVGAAFGLDVLVTGLLLGTFLGATGFLLGQAVGDGNAAGKPVVRGMAALLVVSALLSALRLPLP